MDQDNNVYAGHLAKVSRHHKVVVQESIYNQSGAKLLDRGQLLSEKNKNHIIKHRLAKPLEQMVNILDSLDAKELYELIIRFTKTIPRIQSVTNSDHYQKSLRKLCLCYEKQPLVRQKLTVMSSQLPDVYQAALFSAVAGLAIALEMELDDNGKKAVFIGGLMHDSGLLHLPEELRLPNAKTDGEQLRRYYSHSIIAEQFLKALDGLPKDVYQAVADHHERVDGTGHPRQKLGESLSIPSQIIAMTDTIMGGYRRYSDYGDYCHNMLMVVLKFNDTVHFESVYRAAAKLFCTVERGQIDDRTKVLIAGERDKVTKFHTTLIIKLKQIRELALTLLKKSNTPRNISLGSMTGHVATCVVRSGLLQPEHEQWLAKSAQNNNLSDEDLELLAETHTIQQEINFQLNRMRNIIAQIIDEIPESERSKADFQSHLDNLDCLF